MIYENVMKQLDDMRKRINKENQKTNDELASVLKALKDGWWIPAWERIPKNDLPVLISLSNDKIVIGCNHFGTWSTVGRNHQAISGVEAWMNLPSPYHDPKDNKPRRKLR